MHAEAIRQICHWHETRRPEFIADIGALNINGSIKDFLSRERIIGFDVYDGKDVDVVIKEGEIPEQYIEKFDGAVMTSSLLCCVDPSAMAKQAYDLLVKGGHLFVTTCSDSCTITHTVSPVTADRHRFNIITLESVFQPYFYGYAYQLDDPYHLYYKGERR